MEKTNIILLTTLFALSAISLYFLTNKEDLPSFEKQANDFFLVKNNDTEVNVFLNWPEKEVEDVLLALNGTTVSDSNANQSAKKITEDLRLLIEKENLLIIGVAYPQENLLPENSIKEAHSSLLWLKNQATEDLNIEIENIYLFGHSLGGYVVTRLNTLEETNGVIVNAPGPLDLEFRCSIIERNRTEDTHCKAIKEKYGSVFENPEPYIERSLISFTSGQKSKIIFIQGLEDKKIQMQLWPKFKEKIEKCTNCSNYQFLEIEKLGHKAFFQSEEAKQTTNNLIK